MRATMAMAAEVHVFNKNLLLLPVSALANQVNQLFPFKIV
jgi:hypothetical protein